MTTARPGGHDVLGRGDPVDDRHLHVEDGQPRLVLNDQGDGLLAVGGLATTSKPSSSSISFRSSRIRASSSAMTTRSLPAGPLPRLRHVQEGSGG